MVNHACSAKRIEISRPEHTDHTCTLKHVKTLGIVYLKCGHINAGLRFDLEAGSCGCVPTIMGCVFSAWTRVG